MEKDEQKNKKLNKILIILAVLVLVIGAICIISYTLKIEENASGNIQNFNSNDENEHRGGITPAKPIIYLYPENETELMVKLGNPEKITCSYPKYEKEWQVTAKTNGTLLDMKTQRELYALYWEGKDMPEPAMTEGFIVKGEDTIKFLEEKLEILGLNAREAEEFIIYWLPKMQNNKYNYIRFATIEEINEYMPLEFSVQPDSIIRVLMQYKSIEEYIEIPEQKLQTPERYGFVAVEWGGSELK